MSKIFKHINFNEIDDPIKRYPNLFPMLDEYKTHLHNVSNILELENKPLGLANREQISWLYFYDEKLKDLKTMLSYIESDIKVIYGKLYKDIKENNAYDLKSAEISLYIETKKEYRTFKIIEVEIKDLYEKYKSIVDAFSARGYILNNLTKLHTMNLENGIMD